MNERKYNSWEKNVLVPKAYYDAHFSYVESKGVKTLGEIIEQCLLINNKTYTRFLDFSCLE